MKRVFAVLGILAVGGVAPIGGAAADCIADQRCAEGQKPPACCQPPPCQMFEYLKAKRAERRMMSPERAEKALRDSEGNHAQAIASLQEAMKKEWNALKAQSNCKLGQGRPYTAPNFRVQQCEVQVQGPSGWAAVGEPMSLLEKFDSCNEVLESAFAEASLWKDLCEGAVPGNTGWFAARKSGGAQANIDSMMGHLQRYWRACSTADLNETTRRQLEEAELTMKDPNPALEAALRALQKGSSAKPKPAVKSGPRG